MKKIIFILLVTLPICQMAEAKKIFVEMEFYKNCIKLDDGTNKKPQVVKDGDGNKLEFISLIGALNYMSLQGWDLVDTKSVTSGSGIVLGSYGSSSTDTRVYYIFSRGVSEEELKKAVDDSYKE